MKTKILGIFLLVLFPMRLALAFGNPDFNTDGCVDNTDFHILQSQFGSNGPSADLDASGEVDVQDFALLLYSWKPCSNTVDISDLYPFAPNHNLTFNKYNLDGSLGSTYEIMRTEPWSDNTHFTVHHYYGNVGSQAPTCPRVDDVFNFNANTLLYTDTYNFYDPAVDSNGLTLTNFPTGDLWGQTTMVKGVPVTQNVQAKQYNITQSNCQVTGSTLLKTLGYQTEVVANDALSWSPYTGGESISVNTILLQETTTYVKSGKTSLFQEKWYFYRDPQYGYIPIEVVILSKSLTEPSLHIISHERLQAVQ